MPINYRLAPVEIADILDGISPRLLAVEDHWARLAGELVSAGRRERLLWIESDNNPAGEPDYETLRYASPVTTLGWNQHLAGLEGGNRLRSVGRPVIGVELRIADDEGNHLPPGAAGEIVARGPNASGGYLDRPEETAAVFCDGWFHTGDVGRLDKRATCTCSTARRT